MLADPLPCDLDAEAACLSAIMLQTENLDIVRDYVQPRDFYSAANKAIYSAILALDSRGVDADLVTVASELRAGKRLDSIGGTPYLGQIADKTPVIGHVADHARIVADLGRLRRVIAVCQSSAAAGRGEVLDVGAWCQDVERAVYDAAESREQREAAQAFAEIMPPIAKEIWTRGQDDAVRMTVPTGFTELDKKLVGGGMGRGDQVVLGGRPGMGKTALAVAIGVNVARAGLIVIFLSLEMTKRALACRAVSAAARVELRRVLGEAMTEKEKLDANSACNELAGLPFVIRDIAGATLGDLRSTVRRAVRDQRRKQANLELGAVIVDYIGLMTGVRERGDSRENEVASLARGLKMIAKEFDCAVITLAQLNRTLEQRGKDKRPQLSDLRESGAMEQDADVVLFPYRDEYYNHDSPDRGIAEVIIAKQRNGPTGKVLLKFTAEFTRFDNLASDEYAYDDFDDGIPEETRYP